MRRIHNLILCIVTQILIFFIFSLISVAFFTLIERKFLSFIQIRKGPNKVRLAGILQPISDAIKLFLKKNSYPLKSNRFFYMLSSFILLILSLLFLNHKRFEWGLFRIKRVLYILLLFSFLIYGTLLTGWFSNSKFSLLGRIRRVAQSISYEVVLRLILFILSFILSRVNITIFFSINKTLKIIVPALFLGIVLFCTLVIEINRSPFDLAECESELVSGFNTEYGGVQFSLIFLGENLAILVGSIIFLALLMRGDRNLILIILIIFIIIIRGRFPRFRFDELIIICWIKILPLILNLGWFYIILVY